jgi:hypothetical protein
MDCAKGREPKRGASIKPYCDTERSGASFQFRYNNCFSEDIFGTAIEGA